MTREEANAKIVELKQAIKDAVTHIEKLATDHNLEVYATDPFGWNSSTFYPDIETFKDSNGWTTSEAEEAARGYGVNIPGWVSSSAFC